MSRAQRLEAQIAAENAKKKTVARAPNFASDARARRRQIETMSQVSVLSPRKSVIPKEPVTPSLFTLQRARQRASMGSIKGETHRLDDPYTMIGRFMPPEPIKYKGIANHDQPFTTAYK